VPRRQRNEPIALAAEEWIGADDERVHSLLGQDCEGRVQIVFAVCTEHFELLSDRARHLLRGFRLGLGIGITRVDENADHGGVGDQLAYQLQALRPQRVEEQADAREVAPRSAEAGHEALLDRVAAAIEDDRNRRGGLLCRQS
jgi:hypothetical protein